MSTTTRRVLVRGPLPRVVLVEDDAGEGGGGGMSCDTDSTGPVRTALEDVSFVAGPGVSALTGEFVQLAYLESGDIIRFIGNLTVGAAGPFWFLIDWSALYNVGRGYDAVPCNALVQKDDASALVISFPQYFGQAAKVYFQATGAGGYAYEVQVLLSKSNKCDD